MFFLALATDYDGTLATEGAVEEEVLTALQAVRDSGRHTILVTGRELPELKTVFPALDLFSLVVAENGALLYRPATKEEVPLAPPPPEAFLARLKREGVARLSVGRAIVATWVPDDEKVLSAIRDLGLDLQIIYNKGAVMVLPAGVNKLTGLKAALKELNLATRNVVGIGDAENDQAFLGASGCAIAVANALPSVKKEADWVTRSARGSGVREAIQRLLETDLKDLALPRVAELCVGITAAQCDVTLRWRGERILIAGTSGGGKTTALTALIEQLRDRDLQIVVLDPEAEYEGMGDLVTLGDAKLPPTVETAVELLETPNQSVALNLLAIPLADRPDFLARLMPRLEELRRKTGRPHWLVLDEAHHMLPAESPHAPFAVPRTDQGVIFVTLEPHLLAREALQSIDVLVAVSTTAQDIIRQVAAAIGRAALPVPDDSLPRGEALVWRLDEPQVHRVQVPKSRAHHRRHVRKYIEGHLGPENSFYFRGPENRLNLRAENLQIFLQMADGIDDDTWQHHLRAGDYSRWFAADIKNADLAAEAEEIETDAGLSPVESRARIRTAIERRYIVKGGPPVTPLPSGAS